MATAVRRVGPVVALGSLVTLTPHILASSAFDSAAVAQTSVEQGAVQQTDAETKRSKDAARRAADERKRSAAADKAALQKQLEEADRAREAEEQRRADEEEMLARARAERAARQAAGDSRAEQPLQQPAEAAPRPLRERRAETRRPHEERRVGGYRAGEEDAPFAGAADPEGEALDPFDVERPDGPGGLARPNGRAAGLVTVLLILEPSKRGFLRRIGTGDPILCVPDGCYVGAGAAAPAHFMPGRKAFRFANVLGGRAGACSRSLACVFRNVDLANAHGSLQPVDLRLLVHDVREGVQIDADSGCRARPGRLACTRAFGAWTYQMWVVPEHLAETAGPAALEAALEEGLPAERGARLGGPVR